MSARDDLIDVIKPAGAHDYWPQKAADCILKSDWLARVRAEARRDALIEAAVLVEWFSDRNPDVYEAAAMNEAADHIRALADKETP